MALPLVGVVVIEPERRDQIGGQIPKDLVFSSSGTADT